MYISASLPPLMNQRSAHPEWRDPINRCEKNCENGGIVENCIRTTEHFLPVSTPAPPLGSRRRGRDIPRSVMHLLHNEELGLRRRKPFGPSHNFLTSPFRRQKRRRECVEAGKLSSICRNYQPENRLHNNPRHNRLLLTSST